MLQDGLQERTLAPVFNQRQAVQEAAMILSSQDCLLPCVNRLKGKAEPGRGSGLPALWQHGMAGYSLACSGHHKLRLPTLNSPLPGTFRWGREGWPLIQIIRLAPICLAAELQVRGQGHLTGEREVRREGPLPVSRVGRAQ